MGEGAGVVILEELEHAKARGAKIYAEVVGYGCSSDAYHITSPQEDGAGAARAMTNAMSDAGVTPADVKYINAHGTGTHHNDLFETRAIKLAFGDDAANLKINSTKSMIGHLLGAAGAVEFITCVKESRMDLYIRLLAMRLLMRRLISTTARTAMRSLLSMHLAIHWDSVDIMQVFSSRLINNLGASRIQVVRSGEHTVYSS